MTATTAPAAPVGVDADGAASAGRFTEWAHDVVVLTRRNLIHVRREPAQLSDATVQPILFTLLFVSIFGSAMRLPGGESYKQFAIGGLITMNLTTASMGTAVGLSTDLATGVISRFRTLPMARGAILAGRTASDLLSSALCASIVVLTGFVIGWRPSHGLEGTIAGLAVALLFAYALTWVNACVGLMVKGPESSQAVGLLILFPLSFLSTCFVPSQGLPHWLALIADWNPVSAVAGSCRNLFGNPNPASLSHAWPAQHPVAAALTWSAVILVIAVPTANRLLAKRTTD